MEWTRRVAIRSVHEAQMHKDNLFVTLTYRPSSLPQGGTLVKKDLQGFLNRLRGRMKTLAKKRGVPFKPLRYLCCGEYGKKDLRPHYHLIIYAYDRIVLRGIEMRPPPVYDRWFKLLFPDRFAIIQWKRRVTQAKRPVSKIRLWVAELCLKSKLNRLVRSLDNED